MREEITAATRLVIVCNPNNPTSTALPLDEIAEFIAVVPRHVAVILDEAYIEFNVLQDPDESVARCSSKHPNLVLLRTFRKVYGLCGLRVGYALCGSEALPHRGRPGAPAVLLQRRRAGRGARGAQPRRRGHPAGRAQPRRADRRSRTALRGLGIEPAESQANFVWFDLGEERVEADVMRGLAERGILVRAGGALGRAGRAARHGRHAGRERALPGSARPRCCNLAARVMAPRPPAPLHLAGPGRSVVLRVFHLAI